MPWGTPVVNAPTKVNPCSLRGASTTPSSARPVIFWPEARKCQIALANCLGVSRLGNLRNCCGDTPTSALKVAEKLPRELYPTSKQISVMGDLGVEQQLLGPLHPQARQEVMRARARDLLKHPHAMKLADRRQPGNVVQIEGLLQVQLHVRDHPLDRRLVGRDRVRPMQARIHRLCVHSVSLRPHASPIDANHVCRQ